MLLTKYGSIAAQGSNGGGGEGGGVDEYTKILLHFDGSDASTAFTDETARAWTAAGNAQLDTAQYKFGTSAGLFDGSGDYIYASDSDDFNVGSGDFTVDCWFRLNATGANQYISSQIDSGGNPGDESVSLMVLSSNKLAGEAGVGSTAKYIIGATVLTIGVWYHAAFLRYGDYLHLYLNGVEEGTKDVTGLTVNNSTQIFSIGRQGARNLNYFNGWIDEYRFSNGIARWTANFTPPTEPY